MMLERSGFKVIPAGSPNEAIGIAQELGNEIHLMITDVVMPQMNGRDLASAVRSLCPKMKLIFMSGYTANAIAHHGVLDDNVNFLQEPFSKNTLNAKIREALAQ